MSLLSAGNASGLHANPLPEVQRKDSPKALEKTIERPEKEAPQEFPQKPVPERAAGLPVQTGKLADEFGGRAAESQVSKSAERELGVRGQVPAKALELQGQQSRVKTVFE